MSKYEDEQLVAMKELIKTFRRLKIITIWDSLYIVSRIEDELRLRHGIFS